MVDVEEHVFLAAESVLAQMVSQSSGRTLGVRATIADEQPFAHDSLVRSQQVVWHMAPGSGVGFVEALGCLGIPSISRWRTATDRNAVGHVVGTGPDRDPSGHVEGTNPHPAHHRSPARPAVPRAHGIVFVTLPTCGALPVALGVPLPASVAAECGRYHACWVSGSAAARSGKRGGRSARGRSNGYGCARTRACRGSLLHHSRSD